MEGIGDIRTTGRRVADPAGDRFLLGIVMHTPVRAAFAIAFRLPDHEGFLHEAATAGHLVLATTPPEEAVSERPLWLAVDLDGTALREALAGG